MNKKNIIIGIIVVIVIMVAFSYLSGNQSDAGSSLTASGSDAGSADAQYIYSLLQQMNAVRLDDSIFSNPSFENLTDNSVSFSSQPAGRDNPFAPINTNSAPVTSSGSFNVRLK